MRRRDFIAGLGSAAAWPVVARGQSQTPVIGFLGILTPDRYVERLVGFRDGLRSSGFDEGRNVVLDYRWARADGAVEMLGRPVPSQARRRSLASTFRRSSQSGRDPRGRDTFSLNVRRLQLRPIWVWVAPVAITVYGPDVLGVDPAAGVAMHVVARRSIDAMNAEHMRVPISAFAVIPDTAPGRVGIEKIVEHQLGALTEPIAWTIV